MKRQIVPVSVLVLAFLLNPVLASSSGPAAPALAARAPTVSAVQFEVQEAADDGPSAVQITETLTTTQAITITWATPEQSEPSEAGGVGALTSTVTSTISAVPTTSTVTEPKSGAGRGMTATQLVTPVEPVHQPGEGGPRQGCIHHYLT